MAKEIDIKLRLGTKIEASEAATLDPAKRGVLTGGAVASEVEGQWHPTIVECPWCGNMGRIIVSDDTYTWFTCGRCGGAFKA